MFALINARRETMVLLTMNLMKCRRSAWNGPIKTKQVQNPQPNRRSKVVQNPVAQFEPVTGTKEEIQQLLNDTFKWIERGNKELNELAIKKQAHDLLNLELFIKSPSSSLYAGESVSFLFNGRIKSKMMKDKKEAFFGLIDFQSPISGSHTYSMNADTNRWEAEKDRHDLEGLIVRDIMRYITGIPMNDAGTYPQIKRNS